PKNLLAIRPRQIRHGTNCSLVPKPLVRKRRNIAHVNPCADHVSPFPNGSQRHRHKFPRRRKDNRRIEQLGRQRPGITGPYRAERTSKGLPRQIARPRKRVNLSPLEAAYLSNDMGRRATTIKPDPLPLPCPVQRPKANQPR